jgi:broad specificity phosphatase PhoE
MRETRAEIQNKWKQIVEEQQRSSQTAKAFCQERGLREWQFFAWKKRLKEASSEPFVEVKVKSGWTDPCPGGEPSKAIEVRLKAGRILMVEPGFDGQHLRNLVAVLEAEA